MSYVDNSNDETVPFVSQLSQDSDTTYCLTQDDSNEGLCNILPESQSPFHDATDQLDVDENSLHDNDNHDLVHIIEDNIINTHQVQPQISSRTSIGGKREERISLYPNVSISFHKFTFLNYFYLYPQ